MRAHTKKALMVRQGFGMVARFFPVSAIVLLLIVENAMSKTTIIEPDLGSLISLPKPAKNRLIHCQNLCQYLRVIRVAY